MAAPVTLPDSADISAVSRALGPLIGDLIAAHGPGAVVMSLVTGASAVGTASGQDGLAEMAMRAEADQLRLGLAGLEGASLEEPRVIEADPLKEKVEAVTEALGGPVAAVVNAHGPLAVIRSLVAAVLSVGARAGVEDFAERVLRAALLMLVDKRSAKVDGGRVH